MAETISPAVAMAWSSGPAFAIRAIRDDVRPLPAGNKQTNKLSVRDIIQNKRPNSTVSNTQDDKP
jgi:hypothetical protein